MTQRLSPCLTIFQAQQDCQKIVNTPKLRWVCAESGATLSLSAGQLTTYIKNNYSYLI